MRKSSRISPEQFNSMMTGAAKGVGADFQNRKNQIGSEIKTDKPITPNTKEVGKSSENNKIRHSEDDLQAACVKWFRVAYSDYLHLFAIPNGGKRNVIEAAHLKRTGVLAGVSDLFLSLPRRKYHGAFFELKVGKNKPTDTQIAFMEAHNIDYYCKVIYSLDEFIREVNNYLR